PEENDSKVSRDKETLTQDLGDRLLAQAAVNYNFLGGFTLSNAYTYQSKQKDQYVGDKYASKRYGWLEQETAQEMHAYTAALGYSTIELFRSKKFPAPIQAGVFYTTV